MTFSLGLAVVGAQCQAAGKALASAAGQSGWPVVSVAGPARSQPASAGRTHHLLRPMYVEGQSRSADGTGRSNCPLDDAIGSGRG
jgi:hypothetical protein